MSVTALVDEEKWMGGGSTAYAVAALSCRRGRGAVPKSMVLSLLYWQPQLTSKAVSCPRNSDTAQRRCCGTAAAAGTNIRCGAALTTNHHSCFCSLPNSFALLVLIHIFDTTVVNPLYISLCLLQRSYNLCTHHDNLKNGFSIGSL